MLSSEMNTLKLIDTRVLLHTCCFLKRGLGVPLVAQWVKNPTSIHEDTGLMPGGLRIWCCRELWHRSQMQLGSGIAVAVA